MLPGGLKLELHNKVLESLRRCQFSTQRPGDRSRELVIDDTVAYAPEEGASRIILRINQHRPKLFERCTTSLVEVNSVSNTRAAPV